MVTLTSPAQTSPAQTSLEATTLDESGTLLGDRYRLIKPLGEGGAGIVYAARDERIGAEVAVKVVRGSARRDEVTLARFHREAKAAGRLGHPNIVRVTDFGTSQSGSPFVVMERLDGETLDARIARTGPLEVAVALDVHVQLADALAAAHAAGVLHRDVKPANVFLTQLANGRALVKLLDFGLAELYAEPTAPRLTERGLLVGSLAYLAPERIEGQPADERGDVYAIGASLYESLTGALPFAAPNPMMLRARILGGALPPLRERRPEAPEAVEALLASCLARDPAQRFASAAEVRRALLAAHDELLRQAPVPAPGPRPASLVGPLAVIAGIVLLAGVYLFARSAGSAPVVDATPAAPLARVASAPSEPEAAPIAPEAVPAPIAPEAPLAAPEASAPVLEEEARRAPEPSARHRPRGASSAPSETETGAPSEPGPEPEGGRFDRVMEPDWGEPVAH